jgi:hypothetical protein
VTASYVAFVNRKSEKGKAKGSAMKSGLVQSGCGSPSRRIPLYVVNTEELKEDLFHMVESKVAVLVSVVLSILRFVALTVSRPVEKIRCQDQLMNAGIILVVEAILTATSESRTTDVDRTTGQSPLRIAEVSINGCQRETWSKSKVWWASLGPVLRFSHGWRSLVK